MVVFDCNGCGDALKKNQILKHRMRCRNSDKLSCIDCGQDFYGSEYEKHIKCITEEEKYSGKNYKPKANANKGLQKQEQWTEQVQAAIEKVKLNSKLKEVLKTLQDYPNIPRKKAKFINFMVNSMRVFNQKLASEAWEAISAEINSNKESCIKDEEKKIEVKEEEIIINENKNLEINEGKKVKKRKRSDLLEPGIVNNNSDEAAIADTSKLNKSKKLKTKINCDTCDVVTNSYTNGDNIKMNDTKGRVTNEENGHVDLTDGESRQINGVHSQINDSLEQSSILENNFNLKFAIKECLRKAPNQQMQIKKLRKLIFKEYSRCSQKLPQVYTKEEFMKKLNKKLTKMNKVQLTDDSVTLNNN